MTEISSVGSMLPPESSAHDRARAADLAGEQRRDAGRARALDDELRALEQEHDRLADLLVADLDELVEQLVEDRASSARPAA